MRICSLTKSILIPISLLIFSCKAQKEKPEFKWNLEKERIHNENRNDSTKWSLKSWKVDTPNIKYKGLKDYPILDGVFPVPNYDLVNNNFNGSGSSGSWEGIKLNGKTIVHHSLFVSKSNASKENEVFFTLLSLTDFIDTKNFSHTDVVATSRNHPHYAGEGFIKTKSNKIEFVAFTTADNNSYALVNMRLFDLRIGRIVLIAPKKDGTFRSLQLESPNFSSKEMDNHIKELLKKNKQVIDFFIQPDTI